MMKWETYDRMQKEFDELEIKLDKLNHYVVEHKFINCDLEITQVKAMEQYYRALLNRLLHYWDSDKWGVGSL